MTTPLTGEPPAQDPTPFDHVFDKIREIHMALCLAHPEIKTMATVVAWNGDLNDADIPFSTWTDANGDPVVRPDAIFGSVHQTLKLLDSQMGRVDNLLGIYHDKFLALIEVVKVKHDEIDRLDREIAARAEAAADPPRPAGKGELEPPPGPRGG